MNNSQSYVNEPYDRYCKYGMPFEEFDVLPCEEKLKMEREYNLRRPRIVIKTNNGTFYI